LNHCYTLTGSGTLSGCILIFEILTYIMILRNESDLKVFYDTHYKVSVRQALRIVNDLAEAEDVVQDCIVKLWDKRHDLKEKDTMLPYFFRMVRNKSIDVIRRRIQKDDGADLNLISDQSSDDLELKDLSESIDALIDSLPEKCRQVFVLSRYENMTYKEIASQLNIAPKTVENQISRALKVLRAGLGDQLFMFLF